MWLRLGFRASPASVHPQSGRGSLDRAAPGTCGRAGKAREQANTSRDRSLEGSASRARTRAQNRQEPPSVSATAITLILIAAVAHASWNLFSKQAAQAGAISFIWLAATAGTLLYIPVIAVAWAGGWLHLTALGWVFMAGTGVLESAYFVFLQSGYRLGDLSLVYPVGRGTGALLAAVAGIAFLGERPGPVAVGGIIAVVAGIALIGAPTRAPGPDAAGAGAGAAGGAAAAAPAVGPAIGFAIATGVF